MLLLLLAQLSSAAKGQVLVYSPTFNANERTALNNAGYTNANIIVVSGSTWSGYSTTDFANWDFIWVGDKDCGGPSSSDMADLVSSASRWQAAITGRVVMSGADAACHYGSGNTATFLDNIASHLKGSSAPAAYLNAWGAGNWSFASGWGVAGAANTHGDDYTIVGSSPVHAGCTSSGMSNWGSTFHAVITTIPSGWTGIGRRTSSSTQFITIERGVVCPDADGDGFTSSTCGGTDCNDANSLINPGRSELCSTTFDDNCDGRINDASSADASTWYRDADGDTFGSAATTTRACTVPSGFVSSLTDCNDADAFVFPGATETIGDEIDQSCDGREVCFLDADDDGYRLTTTIVSADVDCRDTQEATRTEPTGDCDDSDRFTNPGATEIVADGKDQTCDGREVCFQDNDNDRFRTTLTNTSTDADCSDPGEALSTVASGDCDDFDALTFPGASEVVGDEKDQSCDGRETCFADFDDDGWRLTSTVASTDADCADTGEARSSEPTLDCDDRDRFTFPGATEVIADGKDQSCDGREICYQDLDADRYRTSVTATSADADCADAGEALASMASGDCDDSDRLTFPGATEIIADEKDQSCDGREICYEDLDGDRWRTSRTSVSADADCADVGEASASVSFEDCDDDEATTYPGATETAYDGVDQDCNGEDLCDVDLDGYDADLGLCAGSDCDDDDALINPRAVEVWYDGIDQDCDAGSDYDADFDGFDAADYGGEDCDDADADTFPGAEDDAYDGIDRDCDEASDFDLDGDGFDSEEFGGEDCDDENPDVYPGAPELADGIDNDCDGVDEDDDTDGDGVPDEVEFDLGTDPASPDSDDDGVYDGVELGDDFDAPTDTDNDGVIDALDTDDDGDGVPTDVETGSTEPGSALSEYPDTDGDGTPDFRDVDSDDDGFEDKVEGLADTDKDGIPDRLDEDSDGDGIPDADELPQDSDGDGAADRVDGDDDGDDLPTTSEGDVDTDGDGTPDYLDPDSDGDGVEDLEEGGNDGDCDGIANYLDANDVDGPCANQNALGTSFQSAACPGGDSTGGGAPLWVGFVLAGLATLGLRRRRG